MTASPITAYMAHHPHTIGREQTVAKAHEVMRKYGIRHLPVLDGGRIVGLVSERDLFVVEGLRDVDAAHVTVEEAMSQDPYVVPPTKPLGEVVREMAAHKYGSVIVAKDSAIIGVFTTVDALKALSDTQTWEARHPF